MATSKKVSVFMVKTKETKGTWQYKEEDNGKDLRQQYVSKAKVKYLDSPERIKVTVEAA